MSVPPPEVSPQITGSLWELIAVQLRRHRKERGMSGEALGRLLDVNRSTVSRYESGKLKLQEHHAIKIDIAWNTNWLFTNLVRFAKEGHDREWFATHLELESKASELRIWEYAWIPGLFQTEDYTRALVRAAGLENIDAEVAARLKRQERLSRPGAPAMWVILDENVITAQIGSPEVMRAQLARLLELAERPNISVRIVPRSAGEHVGRDGSFKIMTVDGVDSAYIEAAGEGRLVQDATDVRSYRARFDRVGDVALPVRASIDLIRQVMEGLA
ncbi:helix-turn-helix domain-containing protein [Actinomadura gamaensis]|uniref:Scr1 family TA system antitoxin-like transcriptional regulator n=1 Tax=Actinomadura gamaensis TaxID=1763541 RepID=A0ABV9UC31_9ACTN